MQDPIVRNSVVDCEQSARKLVLDSTTTGFLVIDSKPTLQFYTPSIVKLLDIGESSNIEKSILHKLELEGENFNHIISAVKKNGEWEGGYKEDGKLLDVLVKNIDNEAGPSEAYSDLFLFEIHDSTKNFYRQQNIVDQKSLVTKEENIRAEVLAQINHELKTPLHTIKGYCEHILANQSLDPEYREYLSEILKANTVLLDSVNESIHSSRDQNQRLTFHNDSTNINQLLQECISLLQPSLRRKNISIDVRATNLSVCADQLRLKQVLLNLITNAIKYNAVGGEIGIQAVERDGSLHIRIMDTGIGMTCETQKNLFSLAPIAKGQASGRGQQGLGLVISRKIVELMNGELNVASYPGLGSLFSVNLPLNAPQLIDSRRNRRAMSTPLFWAANTPDDEIFCDALAHIEPYVEAQCLADADNLRTEDYPDNSLLVCFEKQPGSQEDVINSLKPIDTLVVDREYRVKNVKVNKLPAANAYTNQIFSIRMLIEILETLSKS